MQSSELKAGIATCAVSRPSLDIRNRLAIVVLTARCRLADRLRDLDVAGPHAKRAARLLGQVDGFAVAAPGPEGGGELGVGKGADGDAVVLGQHRVRDDGLVHGQAEGEALGGLAGVEQGRGDVVEGGRAGVVGGGDVEGRLVDAGDDEEEGRLGVEVVGVAAPGRRVGRAVGGRVLQRRVERVRASREDEVWRVCGIVV